MFALSAVALLLLVSAASASSAFRNTQRRVQGTAQHSVTLFAQLKSSAAASCDAELMAVSDPDSAKYGQHLSFADMAKFSDMAKFAQLKQWATAKGLQFTEAPNGEFIRVTDSAAKIEEALKCQLFQFELAMDTSYTVIGAVMPAGLPAELKDIVDAHTGLDRFPSVRMTGPMLSGLVDESAASGVATPQVIFDTYKIKDRTVASTRATNALFGALGQSFAPSDVTAFHSKYGLSGAKGVTQTIGPNSPSSCQANPNNCVEASLDVQQMTSIAQGGNTTFWSVPSSVSDIFVAWITQVAANSRPPLVHSISYGSIATEDPHNDMKRFNTEICKMGLRGLTVMVASGDDGVANFIARNNQAQCGFTPSYPATSPYVTAVGATQGPESGSPEIACTSKTGGLITSGGGFSQFFKMPAYQEKAVTGYLAKGSAVDLPPKNLFSSTGRAYPDVASMGHNFPIVLSGNTYEGSGTSAACPDFAAMVALVNGQRLKANKSALGFLNPAIYSKLLGTTAFHDITSGRNNCCAGSPTSATCCQYGFNATQGWDPITGAGSVNFPDFSKGLMALSK